MVSRIVFSIRIGIRSSLILICLDALSCFPFDSLSAYSIPCRASLFPTISRRFVFKARVGDDFSDLLIALATLDAPCWIMFLMVSPIVSMSSTSCGVSNCFLNSNWNSIFVYPNYVASTLGGYHFCPFHLYVLFDVVHSHSMVTSNVALFEDCYETMSGTFVRK